MPRSMLIAALLAVSALSLVPRTAHACGGGGGYGGGLAVVVLGGAALGVGDGAMLISDAVIAANHEVPSMGHGVGELILALPNVAVGGLLFAANPGSLSNNPGYYAISTAFLATGLFLGAHAVWTFTQQPPETVVIRPTRPFHPRPAPSSAPGAAPAAPPADPPAAAPTAPPPAQLEVAPAPPVPAAQLSIAPTVLAFHDRAGDKMAPGVGALLRF